MGDIDKLMSGQGSASLADAQLQKLMFEGSGPTKKKPKFPDISTVSAETKEESGSLNFNRMFAKPLGRFYFLKFVEQIIPKQGTFLGPVSR